MTNSSFNFSKVITGIFSMFFIHTNFGKVEGVFLLTYNKRPLILLNSKDVQNLCGHSCFS